MGTGPSFELYTSATEIVELPGLSDVHHLSIPDLVGFFPLGNSIEFWYKVREVLFLGSFSLDINLMSQIKSNW